MGLEPIFYWYFAGEAEVRDQALEQLLAPVVRGLGYELLGILRLPQPQRGVLLRLYLDSEAGITVDDCERVSHQVSGVLDVEEVIRGEYILEVSSPGLDRPLFTLEHFQRFIGATVKIRLHQPVDNRRNFNGVLRAVQDDTVLIEDNGTEFSLPYGRIERANLVA